MPIPTRPIDVPRRHRLAVRWIVMLAVIGATPAEAAPLPPPIALARPADLAALLAQARASVPARCADMPIDSPPMPSDIPSDTLISVLCRGELRVGTRADYPPFGHTTPEGAHGFEPALARRLAASLGVRARFIEVSAADRMAALGERRVDVLIATTGHTVQRDSQALFVQPHYYESHTVIVGRKTDVIGPMHRFLPDAMPARTSAAIRGSASSPSAPSVSNASSDAISSATSAPSLSPKPSWNPVRSRSLSGAPGLPPLEGRTVCVVIGNATNAELAVQGARLMLFGSARRLVEQIQNGTCALAAHDDSLLLPMLPSGYEVKSSFAPLPWGVVVGSDGGASLARVLGLALRALHAEGGLRQLAQQHGVDEPWLQAQQGRWSTPPCNAPRAESDARCSDAPHDSRLEPAAMADAATRLERWLKDRGLPVTLAMLKTRIALRLFLEGIGYSIALSLGAVLATLVLALAFGAGLAAQSRLVRWPAHALLVVMQSTPMVMLMSGAGVLLSSAGLSTPAMAWLAAVCVLGLFNGSNAGQAVAEARAGLLADGRPARLRDAAMRAHAQIAAFAVNATRGSPVASLIGVPELLAAQTDIASFSSESATTFGLLLVFYMTLVSCVVAGLGVAQRWMQCCSTRWGEVAP